MIFPLLLVSMLDLRPDLADKENNIFWIGDVDPDTVRISAGCRFDEVDLLTACR